MTEAETELISAARHVIPFLERSIADHNKHLRGADPESQFYGEDIATPVAISKLNNAIAAFESSRQEDELAGVIASIEEVERDWRMAGAYDKVDACTYLLKHILRKHQSSKSQT